MPIVTNTGTNESNTKAAAIAPNILPDILVMAITDMVRAAITAPSANIDGNSLLGFIREINANACTSSDTLYEKAISDANADKLT